MRRWLGPGTHRIGAGGSPGSGAGIGAGGSPGIGAGSGAGDSPGIGAGIGAAGSGAGSAAGGPDSGADSAAGRPNWLHAQQQTQQRAQRAAQEQLRQARLQEAQDLDQLIAALRKLPESAAEQANSKLRPAIVVCVQRLLGCRVIHPHLGALYIQSPAGTVAWLHDVLCSNPALAIAGASDDDRLWEALPSLLDSKTGEGGRAYLAQIPEAGAGQRHQGRRAWMRAPQPQAAAPPPGCAAARAGGQRRLGALRRPDTWAARAPQC
jgi:hypothetical protein